MRAALKAYYNEKSSPYVNATVSYNGMTDPACLTVRELRWVSTHSHENAASKHKQQGLPAFQLGPKTGVRCFIVVLLVHPGSIVRSTHG